jgi:lysophospholipase L1-like esterase
MYDEALASFKAKHVTTVSIMLGTNDARKDLAVSPQTYRKNLANIVDDLLGPGGMTHVIINYPPYAAPTTTGLWNDASSQRLQSYMAEIDTLASGDRVVRGDTSAYDYFKQHQNELKDGVHPNETGNKHLGELWASAYRKAFDGKSPVVGLAR